MGRTPTPLTIYVYGPWVERPEIAALEAKGHEIVEYGKFTLGEPDLILHPAAHRWSDEFWDTTMLEAALKRARMVKRAKA